MTREGYLKLKYWSDETHLRIVRLGFFFFLSGALYLTLSNISVVFWTSFKLIFGGTAP